MTEKLTVTELEAERITLRHPSGKGGRIELRADEGHACIVITGPAGDYPNVEIGVDGENTGIVITDRDPRKTLGARIRAEITLDRFGTATVAVYGGEGEQRVLDLHCPTTATREAAKDAADVAAEAPPRWLH